MSYPNTMIVIGYLGICCCLTALYYTVMAWLEHRAVNRKENPFR